MPNGIICTSVLGLSMIAEGRAAAVRFRSVRIAILTTTHKVGVLAHSRKLLKNASPAVTMRGGVKEGETMQIRVCREHGLNNLDACLSCHMAIEFTMMGKRCEECGSPKTVGYIARSQDDLKCYCAEHYDAAKASGKERRTNEELPLQSV
jgi:hypothetical protein